MCFCHTDACYRKFCCDILFYLQKYVSNGYFDDDKEDAGFIYVRDVCVLLHSWLTTVYVYLCGFRICSIQNGRCKQCGKSSYVPVYHKLYDCDVCFTRWRFNYSKDFFMDSILLGYGNADT